MRHLILGILGILAAAALGCTGPDYTALTLNGPPFSDNKLDATGKANRDGELFRPVSKVLEQRCGTLDCHGSTFRPLRIYGQLGLRMPVARADWNPAYGDFANYYSGTNALKTTPDELLQNYQSAIALEPELTNLVITKQALPDTLTFIRKPRLQEKHKGGQIWNPSNPGDQCLTLWLTAGPAFDDAGVVQTFNSDQCTIELMHN